MSEVAHTPQLRFPEFSGAWNTHSIGKIGTFFSGGTPASSNKDYYSGTIPFIGSGKISSESVKQHITQEALDSSSAKIVNEGDLLYALYGATSGAVALSKINGAINQAVLCIRTNENKFFLKTWLEKNKERILGTYLQGGQGNLSAQIVKSLKLNLPTKPEQQKIAAFLAAVDSKIEQLSKKQALLGEYKKGLMQQIFSQAIRFKADDGSEFPDWEDNTIDKALHSYKLGGNYSNSEAVTDYPLIKMGNLDRGNIKLNKLQYINTEENIDDSDKINYGDLFFNTRNTLDLVGKVAIWRDELPCAYYNSNLMKMEFSDNFFMNYRFNSFDGIKALRRVATGTTSVAAIYTKDLLKIKFSLPTLSEQQKIANFLSSIDTKIEQAGKQLDESKQFKKALLQQMFV